MTINDSVISEQGMCEEEQVARIAWFYYHDGLTQSEISDRLGLTRLKVSRLLEKGHQSGIIRVQINSRFEGCLEYETQLRRQFSLQHVRVIPGLADADVGGRLGIGAAHMLMSLLQPQQMLAIGFGEATMNTLQRLSGFISSQQIRLVTLSGGVGSYMTGIGQLNAACSVNIIPAPLRASSADIARTLKKGDVVTDIKIHNELIGLPLSALKTIPVRVGVAGGENKAEAIASAMKGGYINALVTDQDTAAAILRS
ncbi:TPA: sugar-binding domain-containing protein [Escherichia coli]